MKGLLLFALIACSTTNFLSAQQSTPQYKVVTIVESIIPGGGGRSRIIETKSDADIQSSTTERTSGGDGKQSQVKRRDLKADDFSETKLLNFYSLVGINFQNIASNDALITAKIDELSQAGWKLSFVTSGVESDAGSQDGQGIFITRLIFNK